jgi:hypothetical protein
MTISEDGNAAELAMTALARDLVEELAAGRAIEMTAGLAPARPRDPRTLTPTQLSLAEAANPDLPAAPDRPGHGDRQKHCDYCGGTRGELVPGPDGEDGYWLCADERGCIARHAHRYPPRPDLVPSAALDVAAAADAARISRQPVHDVVSLSGPEVTDSGQAGPGPGELGWFDSEGGWHAPGGVWAASPWGHTLRNPAHRSHLLGPHAAGLYGHLYRPSRYSQILSGQQAEETSPGQAGPEIPAEGVPEGVRQALDGDWQGGDVHLQQPDEPGGGTPPPARQPSRGRGVYGRRRPLRYTRRR